ncbi:GyrI-like domain-containing protein [Heyndrickxia sp. MSNUG]|uniref:GyrI-like domain-containing protein n=1 Tax=Heyndrickxia sp. MSNUG TaxID=3136677 RepID=UPI003C2C4849
MMFMCKVVTKDFKIIGMKHKGYFNDYGETVPKAAQQFLEYAKDIPNNTGLEVTVYEPPKQPTQLEGIFLVGMLVNEHNDFVPEGMEYMHIQHSYAVIKGKGTEMGNLYSVLDKWILEQSYDRATPEQYIIEVYHPVQDDVEDVEVYIPLKINE